MARRRDVIIGVIIAASAFVALAMFGLMMAAVATSGGGFNFGDLAGSDVGVVEVFGVIDDDMAHQTIKDLERFQENGSIEAIVVHVNSPGGGVAPSQEIYDAILRAREDKPVVVAMASVAASGGYYIACAGDMIVANPGSLTGSIGVIFQFTNFGGLMDKVGVSLETVKSGELKDVGSPDRPLTEKERAMLQSVVMDTYEQFVNVVAENRDLEKEKIYEIANGSVFTGLQAKGLGLVDTLGGLHEAAALASEMANGNGEPNLVRPVHRDQVTIFDLLGQTLSKVNSQLDNRLPGPRLLYLYQ